MQTRRADTMFPRFAELPREVRLRVVQQLDEAAVPAARLAGHVLADDLPPKRMTVRRRLSLFFPPKK